MTTNGLTEEERAQALEKYRILQPYLDKQTTLKAVIEMHGLARSTVQRWVQNYRMYGLAGLVRKRRNDYQKHRIPTELQQLIEGLALQKTRPSSASIHRQIIPIAEQHGWKIPSYDCVHDIVRSLDPDLVTLAHEGTKAYRQTYDLLYRREASRPNEIWQADHCLLDIWLLQDDGQSARPWLTVVEDDYSRMIAGYYLGFDHPNTQRTALALRQSIWRKMDPNWTICGIPEQFYTDNGSDFTSRHMEQVSADLKIQLIFSIPGMPRGRGRVERFFQSHNQLFLHQLPGYGDDGKPLTEPSLTLSQFQDHFKRFLLENYHQRIQKDQQQSPQQRWEVGGFLPQMPETLAQLDLLLLTSVTTRRVRRDGIHFQNQRYMDVNLAAFIGEDVIIRYDPRDMAEIRVYLRDEFLCSAVCQELAGQTVTLEDIIRARNKQRRALRQKIGSHQQLVQTYLDVHHTTSLSINPEPEQLSLSEESTSSKKKLKRYHNE